ncbi:MAG: hypothetical protein J6V09_03220 [Clostridia bacterium]|nr:hypothetical protein [Clostridia bacterium]
MAEKPSNVEMTSRSTGREKTTEDRQIDEIIELVKKQKSSADARKSHRERLLSESEEQTKRRIERARAAMEENTRRAREAAESAEAERSYREAYRQRLAERENKNAEQRKTEREAAERAEKERREFERKKEIEEFLRREKEANEARMRERSAILARAEARAAEAERQQEPAREKQTASGSRQKAAPDGQAASRVQKESASEKQTASEKQLENAPESVKTEEPRLPDTQKSGTSKAGACSAPSGVGEKGGADEYVPLTETVKNNKKSDTPPAQQNEKIVIEIGEGREKKDGELVINIGGHVYGAAEMVGNRTYDEMLHRAKTEHVEREIAAIRSASGDIARERLLLAEELERYKAQVEEIKRAVALVRGDSYVPLTPDSAHGTDEYDAYLERERARELIDEADELAEYEKYLADKAADERRDLAYAERRGYSVDRDLTDEELLYGATARNKQELLEYEMTLDYEEDSTLKGLEKDEQENRELAVYAKSQLRGRLNGYMREQNALRKKMRKLVASSKQDTEEERLLLTVKCIGVQKEITTVAAEALTACVYASVRSKTAKFKKQLLAEINIYNDYCESYEEISGKPLTRISREVVDEVLKGKSWRPIPNVYYLGDEVYEEAFASRRALDAERRRRLARQGELVDGELARAALNEPQELTRAELIEREKRRAAKMSAIKRATERDVLLVGLRNEYRIAYLEGERDILNNSYSADGKRRSKELASVSAKISKLKRSASRAMAIERDDNARYYMLFAMDAESEKNKKNARRDKLDALKLRLEVLLNEREDINERLIALYGGTDRNLKKVKIDRKATRVRKKHAKYMYRKQRNVAAKIDSFKAPIDIKEKAFELLNKKTRSVAVIEESYYKLKKLKPTGRAKKELLANVKRAKADIRSADSDLRFIMKKLKRQHERYEVDRSWTFTLIAFGVVAIAGVLVFYVYGDRILEYIRPIIDKFRGR